jgi:hypothetical protein
MRKTYSGKKWDASHLTGVGLCLLYVGCLAIPLSFRQSATPSFCDLDHKKIKYEI